jgi:hypothetical protein
VSNIDYLCGVYQALHSFGLDKTAGAAPAPEASEPSVAPGFMPSPDLAQGALTAGLAAAPFAGLIGQKPIIHDPLQGAKGTSFKTMGEVARAARAGDVLMTSKPEGSLWKHTITPFGGSEFYHAQPVTHTRKFRGRQQGVTTSAGELYKEPGATGHDLVDVPGRIPQELEHAGYSDVVLLRPKQPLNKAQTRAFTGQALDRSSRGYDYGNAVKSWLKDVFVPKLPGITDRGAQTICEGNICSTVPAQALKDVAGIDVVPGKKAKDVFPTDFLRSENFELVGSHVNPQNYKMSPAMRKAMPYAARAGLGAGMAGTAYMATEYPEYSGAIPGALAGDMAATALSRKLRPQDYQEFIPSAFDAAESLLADPVAHRKYIRNFGLRRLPAIAAGAGIGTAATYGLVNKIRELMGKDNQEG